MEFTNIPIGTFVVPYGRRVTGSHTVQTCSVTPLTTGPQATRCTRAGGTIITTTVDDFDTYSVAITEAGLIMPPGDLIPCEPGDPTCNPPQIPEPTSLLQLGIGLLAIGKKLRKRQEPKQSESENPAVV